MVLIVAVVVSGGGGVGGIMALPPPHHHHHHHYHHYLLVYKQKQKSKINTPLKPKQKIDSKKKAKKIKKKHTPMSYEKKNRASLIQFAQLMYD